MLVQHNSFTDATNDVADFLATQQGNTHLVIVESNFDSSTVLKKILPSKFGTRVVTQADLINWLPSVELKHYPLLSNINSKQLFRRRADDCVLLARLYFEISKTNLPNSMVVAKNYHSLLNEMYNTGLPSALANFDFANHEYAEEIALLASFWDKFCDQKWQQKKSDLSNFANEFDASVAHLHYQAKIPPLIQEYLNHIPNQNQVKQIHITLGTKAQNLQQLWATGSTDKNINLDLTACGAETNEDVVQTALNTLATWLNSGIEKIGIIGFDRTLVRRLHSVCVNNDIHILDRTGWLANNLLVGNVLLALVEQETTRHHRERLVQLLARQTKKNDNWIKITQDFLNPLVDENFESLTNQSGWKDLHNTHEIADWFAKLAELATKPPIAEFIENDLAGRNIVSLLQLLADNFAADDCAHKKINQYELRLLLHQTLSSMSLIASKVKSDIELILPESYSSVSDYDAIMLLGADATSLPKYQQSDLFNDEIRKSVHLPTLEEQNANLRASLANLLINSKTIASIWNNKNSISPYLDLLNPEFVAPTTPTWETNEVASNTIMNHTVKVNEMPDSLSTTSLDKLMDCPYQFYVRNFLKIKENRDVDFYDAVSFGNYVHGVLKDFHEIWSTESNQDSLQLLTEITDKYNDKKFDTLTQINHWLWKPFIVQYADLMNQFSNEGWEIKYVEKSFTKELKLSDKVLTLHCKLDRLDYLPTDKQTKVVDIKTGTSVSRQDILQGEKPQLSIYASLDEIQTKFAEIWQLHTIKGEATIKQIIPTQSKDKKSFNPKLIAQHLEKILVDEIALGKPLPANAQESICKTCSYAGMCRRQHWQTTSIN